MNSPDPPPQSSPPSSTNECLRLADVSLTIGGRTILSTVSIAIAKGELLGLVGANGSGKSSLLNVLCGYYRSSSGTITLQGNDVTGFRPSQIARLGVGRSFQSVGSFRDLTVLEFVMAGREPSWNSPLIGDILGSRRARRTDRLNASRAQEALEQVGIASSARNRLSDCPYGVRKIADVVRAAIAGATVLLMDEPTSGVGAMAAESMADLCRWFMDVAGGHAIVMVDHDVSFVRSLCPRIVALSDGQVIADGRADDVLADPEVMRTFLGTS